MELAGIPNKVPVPFASADGAAVTPTPLSTSTPGRASWSQGFTFLNMTPLASGGIPPFGQDMNGVLQGISAWAQWQGAGGPVGYDSAFQTTIGGYPKFALISAASGLGWWLSQVDDNASDPDTGGPGWLFVPQDQGYAGNPNGHVAGQQATASSPPSITWDSTDNIWWVCTATGSTVSAVWAPLTIVVAVSNPVIGNTQNYGISDNNQLKVRKNGGAAMTDALPSGITNGWWISLLNADPSGATLTLTVPTGKKLNDVTNGTLTLVPGQTTTVNADASGNFWLRVPPVPVAFSGQAIYINASPGSPLAPGVYDIDTTLAPVTLTLESGGANGDNYEIRDVANFFATNNCVINPNTRTVEGYPGNFALDVNSSRSHFRLDSPNNNYALVLEL